MPRKPISRFGVVAQIFHQHRGDVARQDAAAGQLFAVAILGQIGMAAKRCRTLLDRFVEGVLLECVQRVVMHEDLDRRLRRQKMSGVLDRVMEVFQLLGTIASTQ